MATGKSSELLPGTLDLLVLKALARGRMHGYGIAQHLKIVSNESRLLTEGLLLAVAAATPGVALAAKLPVFVFTLIGDGPRLRLSPDFTMIAYTVGLAAIAYIAFALAPALHGTRSSGRRSRLPLRNVLLSAQVAMSVALLIGAALMVTGVQYARVKDPGYRVSDISIISFELPASAYTTPRECVNSPRRFPAK